MVDTVEVTGKVDDVLHDGKNMIVLRAGKVTTVAQTSVPFLLSQKAIEDVDLEVVAAVFEFGVGNGGDGTDASNVGAKADGLQVSLGGTPARSELAAGQAEISELRQRVTELDEECDALVSERDAAIKERDDLQRKLDMQMLSDAQSQLRDESGKPLPVPTGKLTDPAQPLNLTDEERAKLPQLDHDGDGHPGGSAPYVPPALTGKNKSELLVIATTEGVAIKEGATNAEIVDAIEAARADEDEAPAS